MINKTQIKICLGSSCFSRGNNDLVDAIKKYIRNKNIEDKVAFSGDHCTSHCEQGPNIRIAGRLITNISMDNIIDILNENLKEII